ncbi:hypothetical protein [Granulicella arctica]|uniref:hypothetical protein n=1 Tax=Granulicella arctica TaxID=940613 RepID=UPI0021E00E25|nr:hypothetical protein [Granulicella arctica]
MTTNTFSFAARWSRTQVVLGLVLVVTAVLYGMRVSSSFGFPDEMDYYSIALNLRHLHFFSIDGVAPTAMRPPGYPWVVAAIQSVHEGVKFAKCVNLVLWLACAGLLTSMTRRLFGQRAATLALLFSWFYMLELYAAGTLYPQALVSTLFLLSLWMHFVWRRSGEMVEALAQAVVWAALILTVPVFLFNLVVYGLWLLWRRHRVSEVAVIAVIVAASLVAWSARNKVVFHSFFVSDNDGLMLLYGNSPETGANTGPRVKIWLFAPEAAAQKDELARENGYKRAAIAWIKANPKRAAVLYVEKTLNWFNYQTNLETAKKDSKVYPLLIAGVYYPLLCGALVAPLLLPGRRQLMLLFAAQYLVAAGAYAIYFTRIRYRLPYDYLVVMLAAASAAALYELWRERRGRGGKVHAERVDAVRAEGLRG